MEISVVTINLNKRAGLRRTLSSLRGQTDRDFELVVVDGGSTDGSDGEVADFRDIVDTSVSERDQGIYDAWNKGIARTRGDIVALLNSGDAFHPDVISTIRAVASRHADAASKVFTGTTMTVDDGRPVKVYGNQLRSTFWFGIGVVHPAMFIGRRVYEAVGSYEPISIAADTDFVLRCVRRGISFCSVDLLVYMESGGVSVKNAEKAFAQYADALARHDFCSPFAAKLLSHSYSCYARLLRNRT